VCTVVTSSPVRLNDPVFTCEVIGKIVVDLIVVNRLGFAARQVPPARVALVDRKTDVFRGARITFRTRHALQLLAVVLGNAVSTYVLATRAKSQINIPGSVVMHIKGKFQTEQSAPVCNSEAPCHRSTYRLPKAPQPVHVKAISADTDVSREVRVQRGVLHP
jgi:hypothetical protein